MLRIKSVGLCTSLPDLVLIMDTCSLDFCSIQLGLAFDLVLCYVNFLLLHLVLIVLHLHHCGQPVFIAFLFWHFCQWLGLVWLFNIFYRADYILYLFRLL